MEEKIRGTDRWRRKCSNAACPNHRGIGDEAQPEDGELDEAAKIVVRIVVSRPDDGPESDSGPSRFEFKGEVGPRVCEFTT